MAHLLIDKEILIRPGKSVGNFSLGQDMQSVAKILGEPDAGDAAMGKAWGIWYDKGSKDSKNEEIAIYSAYSDSTMIAKAIKQIRVTSGKFKTTEGLGTGSNLSGFRSAYTDLKLTGRFLNIALGDTIMLYDSKSKGICIEAIRDISVAINVHPIGIDVNESYFTYDPKLKRMQ